MGVTNREYVKGVAVELGHRVEEEPAGVRDVRKCSLRSQAAGRRADRLFRGLAPGIRVHTRYPGPVHDHGLVVARPRRQGRAGEDKGHAPGAAVLKSRAERDVDTHAGLSRVMLSWPSGALRQISPSPERTYQYSSMVRKWQARPTIPGGTVEWIMLPWGPSMRKRT
jgi:hypothetical protein